MKKYSLDHFYLKTKRLISLAESFTEINGLSFVIQSCRLKPYNFIVNKNSNLVLHDWWIDEFGNSLKIVKNKKIKIIYNDLSIDKKYIACTDIYYGLSPDKVIKMSKLGFFFFGKDDLNSDIIFLAFLGIDNYLRTFVYAFDTLTAISPLYLGINNLKLIYQHLDIKNFLELKIKNNLPIPCISGKAWLSYMPYNDAFSRLLNHQSDNVIKILRGNTI